MATITDKIMAPSTGLSRPNPTTLTVQKGIGDAILTADDLDGWGTSTAVPFIMYKVDTAGNEIINTRTDWKGIVSGNTITQLLLTAGTDTIYPAGSPVIAAATARYADDLATALSVAINQNGTLKDNSVSTTTITDGSVSYDKLLATIFSGQLTTYTNPGSAGGTNTFKYGDIGGLKVFIGKTASISITGSGFQSTAKFITFPVGFFNTITTCILGVDQPSNTQFLSALVSTAATTTSVDITLTQSNGSNGSAAINVIVIGT